MRPHTIGLLKQKGGAGATTVTVHLAIAAQEAGRRAVVVDLDPQRSASSWAERRENPEPPVIAATAGQLAGVIEAAEADGYDLVIVDTPPHSSAVTEAVARAADLALVPVRPSPLDVAALPPVLQTIGRTKVPALVVLNACPASSTETAEARDYLEAMHPGVRVWGGQLVDRAAFRRALTAGSAVTELGGDDKASAEIRELWATVAGALPGGGA